MKKNLLLIASPFAVYLASCNKEETKTDLVLWYNKSAIDWYE